MRNATLFDKRSEGSGRTMTTVRHNFRKLRTNVTVTLVVILFLAAGLRAIQAADAFPPSGDVDIDRVRAEVRISPTSAENYQKRALLLFCWLGSLQQQGANTHPFFDVDKAYYDSERKINQSDGPVKEKAIQNICQVVDEGFHVLEEVFRALRDDGPIYEPFQADSATAPAGGDMAANWPLFQGNKHFTVPLVINGKVYVGAANRRCYCLDAATGEILWQTELTDWIRSKPAMTSEGLLVAAIDGTMTCLSVNGAVKWHKKISTHPIYADLVAAGDSVLVNDSDLWLRCLRANGDVLWKRSLLKAYENECGERIFTDVLSGGTYYQSKPTAADGKLYFGMPSGFLVCVDAETGKEIWKFEMGGAISVAPAIADGKVFAGQQGGERFFYCVDANTGELIWKQTVPGGHAAEISARRLAEAYSHPEYFRVRRDGTITFWAPVTGATTDDSDYPRSELREMLDSEDVSVNWPEQGTHVLEARCRVTQVPSSQKVIIGQIHSFSSKARPLVKLQFFKGRIEALVKRSPKKDGDLKLQLARVDLNGTIDYQMRLEDGKLIISVNGRTQRVNILANDPAWAEQTFYFKAGAYCQDNDGPSTEGARVTFSRLQVRHSRDHDLPGP